MNQYVILWQDKGERFATFKNLSFLVHAESREEAEKKFWGEGFHPNKHVITFVGIEATPPKVVLHMEGGVIQSETSNVPVQLMVIDYDCEGTPEYELTGVDQGEGGVEEAVVFTRTPDLDPAYTNGRFEKFDETEGREC